MANHSRALLVLGDPTRLEIFEHLAKRPSAVVDIANLMPVSRPAVSQHLKVLKDADLVILDQVGTRHIYRVNPIAIATMKNYLDQLWDDSLASFKALAELEEDPTGEKTQ